MVARKCANVYLVVALFLLLKSCVLFSMSGEASDASAGISRELYVPNLSALEETQVDLEVTQILEIIAGRCQQNQEDREKEEDQRIAEERAAGDWVHGFLPQLELRLRHGQSNLVTTIVGRFFDREISLDELTEDTSIVPYTISLRVTADDSQAITQEHVRLIGQRFPGLRVLDLSGTGLQDMGLLTLARLPLAAQLVALNISNSNITTAGIKVSMSAFKNLQSLNISNSGLMGGVLAVLAGLPFASQITHLTMSNLAANLSEIESNIVPFTRLIHLALTDSFIGNEGLAALSRAPFASNLAYLNIESNLIDSVGITAYMHAFKGLTHLNVSRNNLGDDGLEALAPQPFASYLIALELSDNTNMNSGQGITERGIINSIRMFTALRSLDVSLNAIGDAGLAELAQQSFAPQLMTLNIGSTGITTEGIATNIQAFTGLIRLDVSGNSLGEEGIDTLAQLSCAYNFNLEA